MICRPEEPTLARICSAWVNEIICLQADDGNVRQGKLQGGI